jgi:hypothetical protein
MPQARESEAIADFEYDEGVGELTIRYRTGRTYTYLDVPPEEYAGLCTAESQGGYVNRVIKKHDFREGGAI